MRRTPRSLIGVTSLTLASFLTMGSSGSAAVLRASHSSQLPGAIVAEGRVTNPAGRDVAAVHVILEAWPTSSVLSSLHPGERVPVRVVGSAFTTNSGDYVIRATNLVALLRSSAHNGIVNLEVLSLSRAGFSSFSFSRRIVRSARGITLEDASAGTVRPKILSRES